MDKNKDIQMEAIDERIDKYIRGIMTEEEESAFKNEIKADPELRSHVLATLSLIKGIREQDAAKEKELIQNNTPNKARTLLWWACSIAAVFAIFFGYQKDRRFNELSNIVSPYYSEFYSLYNQGMLRSERGDLDSATVAHLYTLFNNIQEKRNVSDIIEELEPIYASIDSDFIYSAKANDIAFYLALAYIKDDQIDKAIPVLAKIVEDNPDTPIALKAQKILKVIKKLE